MTGDAYGSTLASIAIAPTAPTQNTNDHLIRSPKRRSNRVVPEPVPHQPVEHLTG